VLNRRLFRFFWSHTNRCGQEFRKQRVSSICHINDDHHKDSIDWSSLINRRSREVSCWTSSSISDDHRGPRKERQQKNSASNDHKSNQWHCHSDGLVLILLMFETYSRMHAMNPSSSSISQWAKIIEKAMTEVRKFRVEKQIADALNTRNDSNVNSIHDLFLNSDVLIWREGTNRDKWIESFKLLSIDDETCKIDLSFYSIEFRSTVIKSFLTEDNDYVQIEFENNLAFITRSIFEFKDDLASFTRSIRAKRLFLRYQNVADITIFLQNDQSSESSDKSTFVESRRKK
jgi:hypothetical protein